MLTLFVVVLGGILSGLFTAIEGALWGRLGPLSTHSRNAA